MAFRDLFRRRSKSVADPADLDHFRRWCRDRAGIDGFLEPETLVSVPSLCLVAIDGEWTRRPIGTSSTADNLGRELGIVVYDVMETGYPRRMREYEEVRIARERRERAQRLRETLRENRSGGG